jgi:hypothetical protein
VELLQARKIASLGGFQHDTADHALSTPGTERLLAPDRRLHQVLGDASAFQETEREVVLGRGMPLLGRSLPPNGGLNMVSAVRVLITELALRPRVPVQCCCVYPICICLPLSMFAWRGSLLHRMFAW